MEIGVSRYDGTVPACDWKVDFIDVGPCLDMTVDRLCHLIDLPDPAMHQSHANGVEIAFGQVSAKANERSDPKFDLVYVGMPRHSDVLDSHPNEPSFF